MRQAVGAVACVLATVLGFKVLVDTSRPVVLEPPTCSTCEIILDTLAVLDFTDVEAVPTRPVMVDVFPDGRFVVGPLPGGYEIAVFNADGSFSHLFGKEGGGPREFKGINGFAVVGDSLWVMDVINRRCVVVGADTWEPQRMFDCGRYGTAFTAVRSGRMLAGPIFLGAAAPHAQRTDKARFRRCTCRGHIHLSPGGRARAVHGACGQAGHVRRPTL